MISVTLPRNYLQMSSRISAKKQKDIVRQKRLQTHAWSNDHIRKSIHVRANRKKPCASSWHRRVALFLVSPPPSPVHTRQPWALHSEIAYTLAGTGTWLQELGRRKAWVCLPGGNLGTVMLARPLSPRFSNFLGQRLSKGAY